MSKTKTVSIRMPVSLYDKILSEADKNLRSMSKQIIFMIEKTLKK